MTYDVKQVEAYIRRAAAARGIDPDIAVRAARSEGLAKGVWQSNVVHPKRGREPSYGPFQLLEGGQGGWPTGLGNAFKAKTGMSPSDPQSLFPGIDFALDTVAREGWGQWYGPAKIGITGKTGVTGKAGVSRGAQQQPAPPQMAGTPAPALPPPVAIRDHPIGQPSQAALAGLMAQPPAPAQRQQGMSPMMQQAFGAMAMQAQPQELPPPPPIQGPSPQQATGLLEFVQLLRNRARA
jgi:hypothetical protein